MKRNIFKIQGNTVIVSTAPAGNYVGNELGNDFHCIILKYK